MKSCFKNSVSLYLVRLIEPVFRSIEHRVSGFFKKQFFDWFKHFFKSFSNFSLSLRLGKAAQSFFCRFLPKFLQGFSPSRLVRPFYPSFCSSFLCFHAFFHAFKGYFWTSLNLGFLLIQCYFSKIDHWVLLVYWYIHDYCWLIWSIWGFMKNWKF